MLRASFSRNVYTGGGVIKLSKHNIKIVCLNLPFIMNLNNEKEFECCLTENKSDTFQFVLLGYVTLSC